MNHWQNEIMAEYRRQQLMTEAEEFRLQKIASRARIYHPGLFERAMFHFANWMISTGKLLRNRYEIPAVHCNTSTTNSYAH